MSNLLQQIADLKDRSGQALAAALAGLKDRPFSEADLAAAWRAALNRQGNLYPDGWYDPPPHGIIGLFGTPQDRYQRVCQPSFRPEPLWPQPDRLYREADVIMVYASPVQRATHLIGDFGLSLYRGPNAELRDHFERVWQATLFIAGCTRPGMAFQDLYALAMQYAPQEGFANTIESASDRTGTNIGHTIPLSFAADPTHVAIGQARSFDDIREALRNGRKFINAAEAQRIEPDMAFTIEPRFSTETLPNTWFHLTVVFEGGSRKICHGFTPVFWQMGMERLLKGTIPIV